MTHPGLPLVLALAAAFHSPDESLAPDGRRGFGKRIERSELLSLVRSQKDDDQAFLASVEGLATEIHVLATAALDRYRARGYADVLPRTEEPTLAGLHARFAELEADPFDALCAGDARSRALARMLVDSRFRARVRVFESFELEVREVRSGMAVLRGACDGFVNLQQPDAESLAARIDLAASLMRAMRNDLMALRQSGDDADVDARAEQMIAVARASEGEGVRRAAVKRESDAARELASTMSEALFTVRLRSETKALLDWRRRLFEESIPLREEALVHLPDSEPGKAAPAEIAKLAKHDRVRGAGYRAMKALALDPLDDEACWIAAHAADFLYGLTESRAWYDRFLALRGIRAHDHRTYSRRTLDAREREALDAVQRSMLGG